MIKSKISYNTISVVIVAMITAMTASAALATDERPNMVLVMADDQGWGDTAYNKHPHVLTPVLDDMAATGLRFDRFYTAHPICSPARAGFLTGRTPARMGSFNFGFSIRPEELTFPEVMQKHGYATAHFGKWHVGTVKASSPLNPSAKGFDHYISHDNFFDLDPELSIDGAEPSSFKGESSMIVAEAAVPFMRKSIKQGEPFLIVIWFGSPHTPHRAAEEDLAHYKDIPGLRDNEKNYLGEISGMDRAMGYLRKSLKDLGVAENTLLFYTSDNGPDGKEGEGEGSAGGLRGRKGTIWEGGIREPGIIEWPPRGLLHAGRLLHRRVPEPVRRGRRRRPGPRHDLRRRELSVAHRRVLLRQRHLCRFEHHRLPSQRRGVARRRDELRRPDLPRPDGLLPSRWKLHLRRPGCLFGHRRHFSGARNRLCGRKLPGAESGVLFPRRRLRPARASRLRSRRRRAPGRRYDMRRCHLRAVSRAAQRRYER